VFSLPIAHPWANKIPSPESARYRLSPVQSLLPTVLVGCLLVLSGGLLLLSRHQFCQLTERSKSLNPNVNTRRIKFC
jgi:hypothetical protein